MRYILPFINLDPLHCNLISESTHENNEVDIDCINSSVSI